jgi:hypothetical protein
MVSSFGHGTGCNLSLSGSTSTVGSKFDPAIVVLPLAFDHLSLDQSKSVRKQGLIEVCVRIPISMGSVERQQNGN